MANLAKNALLNALGTLVYIILVVSFIQLLQVYMPKEDNFLIPIAMLLLFVCSAAITGFLVLGKPIILYIDGKKQEAIYLLGSTIAILVLITIIIFISMISYTNLF